MGFMESGGRPHLMVLCGEDLPEMSAEPTPSSLNLECGSKTPATFILEEPTAGAAF